MAACRRGDRRAFAELVELTKGRVFTLAYRLVGDRWDAEDVAQEAYLRAFRGLPAFREDARFETWLHRIVVNTAMSHLRRRGRFGELLAEGQDLEVEEPRDRVSEALDRDEVKRALAELPAGQRAVVVLKDIYGMSCREIGEEMGLSEGAVKVRLHRARKRLKERLYGREHHEV